MGRINRKKVWIGIGFALFTAGLIASIVLNVFLAFFQFDTYLQQTDEIYIMEAGILRNNLEFADGKIFDIAYNFDCEEYALLIDRYQIDGIAGEGGEFERALRLMNEFAPRLTHESYYDNHISMNALDLLDYSLDNKKQGVNCRSKAQILNEMCLSLGIYARKVWIMPNSGYDGDCHVVNEIWDSQRNKWIMLDITNNEYWVDEIGEPLSVLEIRTKGAMWEFCTPVQPGDKLNDLQALQKKHIGDFLYIMKNMAYMEYSAAYGVGEDESFYLLFPENLRTSQENIISQDAIAAAPYASPK